jgi:hypothetical protein
MKVHKLKVAEAPDKSTMLELLTEMRKNVVAGRTLAFVVVEIQTEEDFIVHTRGDLSYARLAGLLGRAQLDALEALRK